MAHMSHPELHFFLEQIRSALTLPSSRWLDLVQSTSEDWEKIQNGKLPLSIELVTRVAEAFDLSIESIYNGTVDLVALAASQPPSAQALPQRYASHLTSRAHTVLRLLQYTSQKFSSATSLHALRRIQFPAHQLQNPQNPVSVRVLMDLTAYFTRYGVTERDHYQMGLLAQKDLKKIPTLGALNPEEGIARTHEKLFLELSGNFDRNTRYRILSARPGGMSISALLEEESSAVMRESPQSSKLGCVQKAGVIATLGSLSHHHQSQVRHPHCRFHGDADCVFEIDFGPKLLLSPSHPHRRGTLTSLPSLSV
jgi:hypothetical protein